MGIINPLPPPDDQFMQQQLRRVTAPPPPPVMSSAPAVDPRAAIAAKYGGQPVAAPAPAVDKAAIAAKFGGKPVTSVEPAPDSKPPGFLTRLGQSLGVPTSEAEARAMTPSTAEMVLGPVATGAKMAYNYGHNVVDAMRADNQESAEALSNIRAGQPVLPNLGKAGYGAVKGILEGPLSIFGGQGLQQAGEDLAQGNLPGGAGGVVGSVINGMLLRSGTRAPDAAAEHLQKVNKLSAAVDAGGSKVDFPAALSRVTADTEQAMRAAGVDPAHATIKDFVAGVDDANRALENEYALAMQPVANMQIVPQAIYNEIMAKANSLNPKFAQERRMAAMLRNRATEWAQPFAVYELDNARKNAWARLQSFESASGPKQAATLRQSTDAMVDKIIADGTRDIIYDTMENYHGQPGMFRDLKMRQSAMMALQPELEGRLRELSNATAKQKGQPLFTGETMHAYGTQHGRVGASIHGLQKTIPLERFNPTGAANLAVRQAFTPPPSMASRATIQALPLRFLLGTPPQKQGPPPPP